MNHISPSIRVVIQQPSLAKYRIPVFRELSARPGIELEVLYGQKRHIPNVEAEAFVATPVQFREIQIGRHPIYWHGAQLAAVNGQRADVAILSWDTHYASLVPALLRAKATRIPTILWGHGYSKSQSTIRSSIRNRIGRLGTAILLYSHAVANQFPDQGWDPQRIFVAQNAMDQEPIERAATDWTRDPSHLDAFQRAQRIAGKDLLLFVSRLVPGNCLELLFEAILKLHKDFPNVQAVLIGAGDPELARLKALASKMGLDPYVRFLGAIYEETELAPWFLSARVFTYPSDIGLSLLHAFGYGLPVITASGQMEHGPEIAAMEHDRNGLFYRRGDATSLAECIAVLLRDEPRRLAMADHARKTVQENFNLKTMVDGMEAAIRYCMASKAR